MKLKAGSGIMLTLLLTFTLSTSTSMCQSTFVEEWVPYVPFPQMVDLKLWVTKGNWFMDVSMTFPDSGFMVSDWGTVMREGFEIWVISEIWDWTGYSFQIITTMSHTYELGRLEVGNYTFTFMARDYLWDVRVKSINLTVVEVAEATTWTVDDDGPADFHTIQEAINAASQGDTIYVYNGTYHEQVVVNKSVSLVGENEIAKTTIVTNETDFTVCISANNVTLSGFEIQNSIEPPTSPWGDWGIILNHSSNSIVNENVVEAEWGIRVEGGSRNNISDNIVRGDGFCVMPGFELRNSDNNVITDNIFSMDCHIAFAMYNSSHNYIAFNFMGAHFTPATLLRLWQSNNNSIVGNTMQLGFPAVIGGNVNFRGSNSNVLYHNNFLGWEPTMTYVDENSTNNIWDNGYPSGGNYWSDHNCPDYYSGPFQNETGSDCISDITYVIDANNTDRYPLLIWGDVNNDVMVTLADIGKLDLIFSGWIPGPPYIDPSTGKYLNPDINHDGKVSLGDIGKLDLIFSGHL